VTDPAHAIDEMTRRLVAEGARAVVLTGSHARSAAGPHSDIDVTAIVDRDGDPKARMEELRGELFSIAWRTADGERAAMNDPARAGAAIPAWRVVQILHDPDGIGKALQAEARAWRWEDIGVPSDAWVAEQVTGYAEEVHKLVGALARGDQLGAAIQRSILALRLGPILAVAERIMYESENVLWHLLDERLGDPWRSTQAAALGMGGMSGATPAEAALELYRLAADRAHALLDERQRAVVERALRLIADSPA
jgi:predicted nucleotidyltransferase